MVSYVEHLRAYLHVQRVVEVKATSHADVLLESAEASNKIAWCVSLGIALGQAERGIGGVDPTVEDAAIATTGYSGWPKAGQPGWEPLKPHAAYV
jgi:hypothetical protein